MESQLPRFEDYRECAKHFACWDGVSPPDDFFGVWEEHYPNGQLKFRGSFLGNQKREGQHLFFLDDGTLKQASCWLDGWPIGIIDEFEDAGFPSNVIEFAEDGAQNGNYVNRFYVNSFVMPPLRKQVARLEFVHVWKGGELIGEWSYSEDCRETEPDPKQGIIEKAIRVLFPEHTKDDEERAY